MKIPTVSMAGFLPTARWQKEMKKIPLAPIKHYQALQANQVFLDAKAPKNYLSTFSAGARQHPLVCLPNCQGNEIHSRHEGKPAALHSQWVMFEFWAILEVPSQRVSHFKLALVLSKHN